ncbi:ATP-dependent zinc metalloprotease FtsH [Trebonia sp.]|uniref:ATP-dependent zinc metalloprotease FtsH n=1 Tax=Trebonia sp. TaxID=2767075 RepID=UPI0026243F83|nr:ATP-dependent zinc metalloprotease FtsH [Trebonia sp.]
MSKQATPPPPGDKPTPAKPPPPPPRWRHWLLPVGILVALFLWIALPAVHQANQTTLTYSQFLSDVSKHAVKTVTIAQTGGTSSGTLTNGTDYTVVIPPQAGQELLTELQAGGVQITGSTSSPGFGTELFEWIIILAPFLLFFWFWMRLSRGGAGQLQGVFGAGRSRAKVFDEERPSTTFSDVAGYEGAKSEISEVVDFLRNPDRYARAGAVVPRGVLMIGPPGTGKTLLARAVAGEAQVPFFSVTGSSFVEMFVGVGAARVRDLFSEARKRAPAIIFIDEVDAIGQRRAGQGAVVANDEREQTLNQLLAEMDGFEPTMGIVVLAATNRPEVLDPALLRPGRFDRQVTIPLPNVSERAAILVVHCRGKRLAAGVDLDAVARGTPGFSGADLANLANEAAIFAVRQNREVVTAADFDAARDRIILGRREGSNVLLPEEKHAVAVHESGHAMVAALSEHADPVAKVTILPAGQTLGVTEQLPLVERHMYAEDYLLDSLAVRLGGRAAELVVLGQGSTGAGNDLAGATDLATKMVREFGMSAVVGPVGYPESGSVFLGGGGPGMSSRPYAEATQAAIDGEVSKLLRQAEERAVELLKAHRPELDALVDLLLVRETVDGSDVYRLAGRPDRSATPSAPAMVLTPHPAGSEVTSSDGSTPVP